MIRPADIDARYQATAVVATLALSVGLTFIVSPGLAQPPLEPVERPRIDHYEQPVQDLLTAARSGLDRLLESPEPDRTRLAAAFGEVGQLYLLYDSIPESAAALGNAETLDPTDVRWPYYLALGNSLEGDFEQAVAALDRVLALGADDLAVLTRRGDALLELGRIDDAQKDYDRILGLDPSYSAAHFGLGQVAFERGEFEQAIERFEAALDGQPDGSVIHHRMGLALRRLSRREEAAAHLARNEQRPISFPDPRSDALWRHNVSREAHIKAGTEAMRDGDPRRALTAFQTALDSFSDDPVTLYNVGMALVELGDNAGAEESLRAAIAIKNDYRQPHYNLAMLLAARNDLEGAERHFRRVAEIDPADLETRTRQADVLTRLGRPEEAIELLRDVLAVDAALPMAQLALGAAYQKAGNAEAAWPTLLKVLEAAPGAPQERSEAHYRLALVAETSGGSASGWDGSDATNHLEQAIELEPDFAEAHALLGHVLARQERYTEAASHYARALARDPANGEWHRDRAMALILGQRYTAVRSGLMAARQALTRPDANVAPDVIDHLDGLLARVLAACPDPSVRNGAEALAIAQRLMGQRPTLDHAETLAMSLAEVGDFEGAATLQQQVLAEVERRGGAPSAGQRQRLSAYRNSEPVREPWFSP